MKGGRVIYALDPDRITVELFEAEDNLDGTSRPRRPDDYRPAPERGAVDT